MGRGDKKTAKGKRFASSHGNARPKGAVVAKPTAGKSAATVKAPAAKAPAKKAPAKKAAAAK